MKQRARRKENEEKKKSHEVLWFNKEYDEEGSEVFISNGKYWEERYKGGWDMCLDIY